MQSASDNLGCRVCGDERGFEVFLGAHRCCYCLDGGRVSRGDRYEPCPQCQGASANPEAREDPNARMRIPWKYLTADFDSWKPDNGPARLRCQGYLAQWPPARPLLFLTGNRGTGKTHLAVAVLKRAYEQYGVRGQFWLAQRLLDRINATYDDESTETLQGVMAELERVPLLVIDDFGSEKSTEAARARLFSIVDFRYSNGRPLVVTSNSGLMDVDQRIKSRLSDGAVSEVVNFTGKDMRPEAGERGSMPHARRPE